MNNNYQSSSVNQVQYGIEDEDATPEYHLMESTRAMGYSLPDAIADLIDNSLKAGATTIWLNFNWAGPDSTVSITDDGEGMTEEVLKQSMLMPSQNPLITRDEKDLGRFGLGMKSASISQAKSLTVASRHSGGSEINVRRWDLDYLAKVRGWRVLLSASENGAEIISGLNGQPHGTMVVWEKLDRLIGNAQTSDESARLQFFRSIREVEQHLAMVFHRFMNEGVRMLIDDLPIEPWDPFLIGHEGQQSLAEETIHALGSSITVRPFVLPHQSRFSSTAEHIKAGGIAGWNAHQGFYVYRNKRLLLAGDWLKLNYKKEEHYKLARIQIDIPNDMDQAWQIDVRKSQATAPVEFRENLKRIAQITRARAVEVYRHRGKTIARKVQTSPVFVWVKKKQGPKIFYQINREHPLIKSALAKPEIEPDELKRILRLTEEYVPLQQIWIDTAESEDPHKEPFEAAPAQEIKGIIMQMYQIFIDQGFSHNDARARLASIEGFGGHYEFIEELLGAGKEDQ